MMMVNLKFDVSASGFNLVSDSESPSLSRCIKDQGPFTQTLKWLGMKNLALAHYAVCTIREL